MKFLSYFKTRSALSYNEHSIASANTNTIFPSIYVTTYTTLSQNRIGCSTLSQEYRSEEHTSELQSRETISYAVFCLKKKKNKNKKKKKKKNQTTLQAEIQ